MGLQLTGKLESISSNSQLLQHQQDGHTQSLNWCVLPCQMWAWLVHTVPYVGSKQKITKFSSLRAPGLMPPSPMRAEFGMQEQTHSLCLLGQVSPGLLECVILGQKSTNLVIFSTSASCSGAI